MAKKQKRRQDRRTSGGRRRSDNLSRDSIIYSRTLLLALLAGMTWFMLPTVVFLFFAMMPTIFILITEKGQYRYTWICTGCMNLLGAMPWIFNMWFGRHSIEAVLGMLTSVTTIITIYTIASIGWVIHRVIPPMVETYIKVSAHKRIQSLYEEQQSLIDEWGSNVVEETAKLRN